MGCLTPTWATNHLVTVSNNVFTPSSLSIVAGDQVTWNQTSGSHNVNGTIATFPANPASFGNGAPAGGTWSYSFTFLVAGTYQYQCDPHAAMGMVGTIVVSPAPCTLPFFSEYIEGSGNNKALEIYNPRSTPLAMGGYSIKAYNNGGLTVSNTFTFPANEIIAPGDVYVIANSAAVTALTSVADTFSTVTYFNGDDAVVLFNGLDTLDIIGKVGFDPGINWVVGTGATSEFTLVRKPTINKGQKKWTIGATEWDVYPQNTATYLGSHSSTACSSTPVTGPVRTPLSALRATDANGVALADNDTVYVTGTVHSIDFDGNTGYSFFIEDGTAGINVYRAADLANYTMPTVGDSLKVYGIIDQYNGLTEIIPDSIKVILTGRNFGSPLSTNTVGELQESRFIVLDSLTLTTPSQWPALGSSANVTVNNGALTYTLRIDSDSDIDGSSAPTGMFAVIGAGGQYDASSPYDAGYQIYVSKRVDFLPMGTLGVLTPLSSTAAVNANGVATMNAQQVVIRGIVTTPDFDGNTGYSFYMQDATGGINVYRTTDKANYTTPTMGDHLEIRGTLAQFNGLTEIIPDSLLLLASGQSVPTPQVVTVLDESVESELVRFNNMSLVNAAQWTNTGTAFNVDITNGSNTLTLRIDADVTAFGTPAPTGLFDVIGVGSQYDNSSPYTSGYQLMPRQASDILPIITTTPTVRFTSTAQQILEGNVVAPVRLYINPVKTSASSVTIHAVAPATAGLTLGVDYTLPGAAGTTLTVTVPANEDTVSFNVNILDDLLMESLEGVDFKIMSSTGLTIGSIDSLRFSVIDNDVFIPTRTLPQVRGVNTAGVLDSLNKVCKLQGVVLGVNTQSVTSGNVAFTIHDGTVGFGVFGAAASNLGYTVNEGDFVRIIGKINQYNGLGQISADSVKLISTGSALPATDLITALGEVTENDLVRMNNVSLVNPTQWTNAGSGFNVDVTDGVNTIQLRIDAEVNLYSMPAPVGTFDIVGIGGQFDNSSPYTSGYQLLPRYSADVIVAIPMTYDLAVTEIMSNSNSPDAAVNDDWFEITNYGTTAVNLNGFSWDDFTSMAGSSIFPAVSIAPGEAAVVWAGPSSDEASFRQFWFIHPYTQIITSDELTGAFQPLSSSADAVILYDTSAMAVEICNAAYASTSAGRTVEFDTTCFYLGNATAGIRGAWSAQSFDVAGSPGNVNTIGLNEGTLAAIRVFPNPTSDRFEVVTPFAGIKTLRVIDVLGKEVARVSGQQTVFELSLRSAASGLYLVEIHTERGTKTLRVVKH